MNEKTYHIFIDGIDTGSVIAGRSYNEALKTVYKNTTIPKHSNRITIENVEA